MVGEEAVEVVGVCVGTLLADKNPDITDFNEAVLAELRVAAAVLPFLAHFAGRSFSRNLYCSDASLKGYALHTCKAEINEFRGAFGVQERWRFREPARTPGELQRFALSASAVFLVSALSASG